MKGSLLQAACGMEIFMNSIIGNKKARSAVEQTAEIIFTICAFFAVLAVISITVYMFLNGTPALTKVGLTEILFSTVWKPTAAIPVTAFIRHSDLHRRHNPCDPAGRSHRRPDCCFSCRNSSGAPL